MILVKTPFAALGRPHRTVLDFFDADIVESLPQLAYFIYGVLAEVSIVEESQLFDDKLHLLLGTRSLVLLHLPHEGDLVQYGLVEGGFPLPQDLAVVWV